MPFIDADAYERGSKGGWIHASRAAGSILHVLNVECDVTTCIAASFGVSGSRL
jgi:hypothetical protein